MKSIGLLICELFKKPPIDNYSRITVLKSAFAGGGNQSFVDIVDVKHNLPGAAVSNCDGTVSVYIGEDNSGLDRKVTADDFNKNFVITGIY